MAAAQVELPFERQLYLQAERLLMAGLRPREGDDQRLERS